MIQQYQQEELLILVKTYPHPSSKYRETTCVAAVTRAGHLRRIFPVSYRLLDGDQRFQKWEWIKANVSKAPNDHRPESYRIDVDSIVRPGTVLGTKNNWAERRQWIGAHLVESFSALEARRQATSQTLGLIRPTLLLGLDITPEKEKDWTEKERAHLMTEGLFDSDTARKRLPLRKLPYTFHYRYVSETPNGREEHRHMITDWEAGALFWNCHRSHGPRWEQPFRQKLEHEFAQKDLLFLMGTMHRFPDQWLIIGLIYPPKQLQPATTQLALDL
jgi:hypothetical protein